MSTKRGEDGEERELVLGAGDVDSKVVSLAGLEVIQSATRMPQLSAERYYAGFCSAKKARPETVERGTQTMARVQDTKKRPKQSKMD